MRRSLAHEFATLERTRVVITLDSRLADEPGPWSVVRVSQDEEIPTFSRLAAACDFTLLVAPETDRILLERAKSSTKSKAARWVRFRAQSRSPETNSRSPIIGTSSDFRPLRFALSNPLQGLPRDATYPAILKPRLGAGCLETFIVKSFNDFEDHIIFNDGYLIQEYVSGESLQRVFLDRTERSRKLIGVAAQNVVREGSTFHYRGGQVPIEVEADCVSIARRAVESVAGLRGWIGVDFIRDPDSGRISLLEINPRTPPRSSVGKASWARAASPRLGSKCSMIIIIIIII